MRPFTVAFSLGAVLSVAALSGCTGGATTGAGSHDVTAVATTTHLGSIVGDITACAGGTSTTLMSPGDDPHEFAVSSAQVAALVTAKLVVANGLGLEGSLEATLASAADDGATVYEVAPDLEPVPFASHETPTDAEGGHEGEDDHHDHGEDDPHVFLDMARMATAAEKIGAKLAEATGDASYVGCGAQVATSLRATDSEVRDILAAVPDDKRVLITDHDALAYFAQSYGFEVAGVVIPGGSTEAEPSSADLAALVALIRKEQVPVVFSNSAAQPKLVEAVAKEAGADVSVVQLFIGSLGDQGSPAGTYSGMMLENAKRISAALK